MKPIHSVLLIFLIVAGFCCQNKSSKTISASKNNDSINCMKVPERFVVPVMDTFAKETDSTRLQGFAAHKEQP